MIEGEPSLDALRNLAVYVRQVAVDEARLGAPLRTSLVVPMPVGVVSVIVGVAEIAGLTRSVVATYMIDGFWSRWAFLDSSTTRGFTLSQIKFAHAFERSRHSVQPDDWSSFAIEIEDRVRDCILKESLRAQIPHGTWIAAAILAFALFNEP